VFDAACRAGGCKDLGPIATSVIGKHAFDRDPILTELRNRSTEERGCGLSTLIDEHRGVRDSRVIIDRHVQAFVAWTGTVGADAGDPVSNAVDLPEPFDVEVK
jgi:hypothetical protein